MSFLSASWVRVEDKSLASDWVLYHPKYRDGVHVMDLRRVVYCEAASMACCFALYVDKMAIDCANIESITLNSTAGNFGPSHLIMMAMISFVAKSLHAYDILDCL